MINRSSGYRGVGRGKYVTEFDAIHPGITFPLDEERDRNAVARFNHRLYSGEYAKNKKLLARMGSEEVEIPYKVIPVNMFKLLVNKLDGLLFGNEIVVKTGDIKRDARIARLIEKTNFFSAVRRAVKLAEIEGDSCIKIYKSGASAFSAQNAYKVVDESDVDNVKGYVLHELLTTQYGDNKTYTHIRFEVHTKGEIFEQVFEYNGNAFCGTIGLPVRYRYKDRWIPKSGRSYKTPVNDCACVQWLSLNREADGCYGQSSFIDFMDIVFTIESRLSSEVWVEDNHEKPFLVLGAEMFVPDESSGGYALKQINGKYLVSHGKDSAKPEYLTWDGKLENSQDIRADLLSYFYELSELGKTFLTGEYQGNISEETLNNTIKSAIDRSNRDLTDFYDAIRDALYCLCKLSGIRLEKDDITINFNVGRSDDDKTVADIVKTLHEAGVFSMSTLRGKYYGYNLEQSAEEDLKISQESLLNNDQDTKQNTNDQAVEENENE